MTYFQLCGEVSKDTSMTPSRDGIEVQDISFLSSLRIIIGGGVRSSCLALPATMFWYIPSSITTPR